MTTPLAIKTTISSRNKISQLNGSNEEVASNKSTSKNNMQRPSQIARNRALRPPAASLIATTNGTGTNSSRLACLANAVPNQLRNGKSGPEFTKPGDNHIPKTPAPPNSNNFSNMPNKHNSQTIMSRLVPNTTNKIPAKVAPRPTISNRISATPHSRLTTNAPPLNSRSSSILSSVSSATTHTSKRPVNNLNAKPTSNQIPDTIAIRKGLAKFSNPIECQRQFQALSQEIKQLKDINEARGKAIDHLQNQLKRSIDMGIGYATTVQYFAVKLRLDSEPNLLDECDQLKSRVRELVLSESSFNNRLKAVEDDYKNRLQIENDLKKNLEEELERTRIAHSESIQKSEERHKNELDDLKQMHSNVENDLTAKIESLQSELTTKHKELADLRNEYDILLNSYNKLEESLTKDKDARVKYAQEKINQLQKDVDSLNSVLDMRSERIHVLERDTILLTEVQNELMISKDNIRALQQQLESVNAALDKKRELYDKLMIEHEKMSQELKRERKERRRMTMRTEQLEYVLNESCAAESTMGFNSSIRGIDSPDHLV